MSDKTIKDRGLSTTTLPAPHAFSFDAETRRQELVFYYQYCVTNALITVVGEQSRIALIKKTFNNLGAAGDTWQEAMRTWLQGQLTSAVTDLYALWLAYFTAHATTPDSEGVTYAGLSVEAAYRRFISDFIGGGGSGAGPFSFHFADPLLITDRTTFKQRKVFADTVTASDAVVFLYHFIRTFSDTTNVTDSMSLRKGTFFTDTTLLTDAALFKQLKVFADTLTITDVAVIVNHIIRTFADTTLLTDAALFKQLKVFADTCNITDATLFRLLKTFADTVLITDSATVKQSKGFFDLCVITDDMLLRLSKTFTDTVTISDSCTFLMGGYNQGRYNTGVYNR